MSTTSSTTTLRSVNQVPSEATFKSAETSISSNKSPKNSKLRFCLVFVSICCSVFLSALDLTSVSTALPEIARDFETSLYSWVASSYTLSSTAIIPWSAGLAHIFGRKPTLIVAILVFSLGSALTGAAQNVPMLIAGRTVQGLGGGAIQTLCNIIVVDLIPIAERGPYFGLLAAVWALASAIGPPVGGALSSAGQWRWLFYMNLPICGVALALVLFCLNLKSPQLTSKEKLARMDWFNLLFIASATSAILGLTWGGVAYEWSSYHVLLPLIAGLAGIILFVYLERFTTHPTVPYYVFTHWNSIVGNLLCFLHSITVLAILYYYPIYLQSVVGDSAVQSGVHTFNLSFTIAPLAIISGLVVNKTGHYKSQISVGWSLLLIGLGLMTLLRADSNSGMYLGFPIIVGFGAGILYSSTNFSVLAPLEPAQQPHGSAFYALVRAAGQVVGISIGSTILQNRLAKLLPVKFASMFGGGEIAFAAIPVIKDLPEPLRSQVRSAFADSIRTIWIVTSGIAGVALLLSLTIRNIPLTKEKDEAFGLNEESKEEKRSDVHV